MIPESLLSMFRRTPIEKVVDDSLHQARLDLLGAQAQAEYWQGRVRTLKVTVARLSDQAEADTDVIEVQATEVVEPIKVEEQGQ